MEHYFTNNNDLKSEIRKINYEYSPYSFTFYSDNGVFSKEKIDYGSRFLLESFLNTNKSSNKILDVGSGYGFLGIVISKVTNSQVTLIDINKRAIHLCKRNIEENKVNANCFVSDVYEYVNEKYDVIITNPPIRAGKEKVLEMLVNAKDYLCDGGCLWFVMRKDHGVKSINEKLKNYYNLEIIDRSKGFYVVKCKI